jgi:hypothetical protein
VRDSFDRRIVPEAALALARECQRRVPCHLGGGAVLSGAWLVHRLSRDLDLFCHDRAAHRELVQELPTIASSVGVVLDVKRDAGTFVRASLTGNGLDLDLDVVHEPMPDLAPPPPAIEGVVVESALDLKASKVTCLLSRSEPRDLVDALFLERAGFPVEEILPHAVKKDGGVDPAILAWLLSQFPTQPLPQMLLPLEAEELRVFRDSLAERMRRFALGERARDDQSRR